MGEGGTDTHGSLDGTGSAPRGSRTTEPKLTMGKDTLAGKTTDSATSAIGGGGAFVMLKREGERTMWPTAAQAS